MRIFGSLAGIDAPSVARLMERIPSLVRTSARVCPNLTTDDRQTVAAAAYARVRCPSIFDLVIPSYPLLSLSSLLSRRRQKDLLSATP